MTTFFDLPLELREIIYRQCRFLQSRENISHAIAKRHDLSLTKPHNFYNKCFKIATRDMAISSTKAIRYGLITYCGKYSDEFFVDVTDVSRVKCHIVVNRRNSSVKLTLVWDCTRTFTQRKLEKHARSFRSILHSATTPVSKVM
jgi:hypothetical protein